MGRGFIIDKITASIEERVTGKNFATDVLLVTAQEVRTINKKDGWYFNWKAEYRQPSHQVFKLVKRGDLQIQGLISLEPIQDQQYIEMYLIETAPHNYGSGKEYLGVVGNLVAFACKMSFEAGFGGFVAFTAKTELVHHYIQTLDAQVIYGKTRMAIFPEAAGKLVNSYFRNFFNGR
jgi:hypothetical protein